MPSSCVVAGCETKYSNSLVSFHKFPFHNKDLLKKWIACTNRGANWKPTKWSAICSRHFQLQDFRNYLYRKSLISNACPSVDCDLNTSKPVDQEGEVADHTEIEYQNMEMICRFCGQLHLSELTLQNMYQNDIFVAIQKCLPLVPQLNESDVRMPKKICFRCADKITQFAKFLDEFHRVQGHLENRFLAQCPLEEEEFEESVDVSVKQVKIKQEPITVIKEEILEPSQRFIPSELMGGQSLSNNDVIEIIQPPVDVINITEEYNDPEINGLILKFEQGVEEVLDSSSRIVMDMSLLKQEEVNYDEIEEEEELDDIIGFEPTDNDFMIISTHHLVDHNYSINSSDKFENYDKNGELFPTCSFCKSYFESKSQLRTHQESFHTHINQTCTECVKEFTTLYDYLIHKNDKHGIITNHRRKSTFVTTFKCTECGEIFKSRKTRNHHRRFLCKHKLFFCTHCPIVCNERKLLLDHMREKHNEQSTSKDTIVSRKKQTVKRPKISCPETINGKFTCKYCNRSYIHYKNLLRHNRIHSSKNRNHKALRQYQCHHSKCCKIFNTLRNLRLHQKIHSDIKPYACPDCGKRFRSHMNLYQHKKSHATTKKFGCDICLKNFKWKGSLKMHKKRHENAPRFDYRCVVCQAVYPTKVDVINCEHTSNQV